MNAHTTHERRERHALRAGGRARRSRGVIAAGSTLAIAGIVAAAAAAYALWGSDAAFGGGTVRAGDITVESAHATWRQVTPGVVDPAEGGIHSDGFVAMPGDVIEFVVPYSLTLTGDNLNAELLVAAGTGNAAEMIHDGTLVASYRVLDEHGEQIAPANEETVLGDPITIPGLHGTSEGATQSGSIIVTARMLGDYRWTAQNPQFDLIQWGFGEMQLSLNQVRSGDGFVAGGADRA